MSTSEVQVTQVLVLGAGGAGMMCAIEAGNHGREVVILDHSKKVGGKILISGGGRCNFTNTGATPAQYVSENPHFMKSALSRFTPEMFIERVRRHEIPFHEKKLGQQFCDRSAQDIVKMLEEDVTAVGGQFVLGSEIRSIERLAEADLPHRFEVLTSQGPVQKIWRCESLVVATGGLSIPKIGATGLGYDIAHKLGLRVTELAPALDGFTLEGFSDLSGLSVDCVIECNGKKFRENVLFTHSGLSGPASLQASLHWHPGNSVYLRLLPEVNFFQWFMKKKKEGSRALVKNLLSELLPSRFAERMCEIYFPTTQPLPQVSEKGLKAFCEKLERWELKPSGTVGYSKAEVTRGGVDTNELSSKTMESKKISGLYFIGEVVDVTGWLGGYNFQWAWASGWCAGQVV
jgi:predicted Rossmann fold flavoprotein